MGKAPYVWIFFLMFVCISLIFFSCASASKNTNVSSEITDIAQKQTASTDSNTDKNIDSNTENNIDTNVNGQSVTVENSKSPDIVPVESAIVPDGAVTLKIPEQIHTGYFDNLSREIINNVQEGSPSSLQEASVLLRKSGASIAENEQALLSIVTDILKILYPTENISWTAPSISQEIIKQNAYLSAVSSAKNGVYDLSAGQDTFLLLVLPSLVLKTTPTLSNYYNESEIALNKAIKLVPDSVLANYLLGMLYRQLNRPEESISFLKKAYELEPSCYQISLDYLNEMYTAAENKTQVYSLATALVAKYPTDSAVLRICALLSFDSGDIQASEEYVARVLSREPENSFFILFRAKILMKKGEYIKASSLLDAYARTDKTAKDYLLLRTQLQRDWNKNNTAAAATIQEGLERYPNDKDILILAAELASSTGQNINNQPASFYINQVLAIDSSNTAALELLVNDAVKNQDWQKAWDSGSVIIQNEAASDSFKFQHIDVCLELGKYDEAQFLADSLYNAQPNNENAQTASIRVLIARGKTAEAKEMISNLLPSASSKQKSSLYYERSRIASGETQQLAALRSSLTANPRNEKALYDLYVFYYKKADYRKAQYYLKQVVALNPSDESLLTLNAELETLLVQ